MCDCVCVCVDWAFGCLFSFCIFCLSVCVCGRVHCIVHLLKIEICQTLTHHTHTHTHPHTLAYYVQSHNGNHPTALNNVPAGILWQPWQQRRSRQDRSVSHVASCLFAFPTFLPPALSPLPANLELIKCTQHVGIFGTFMALVNTVIRICMTTVSQLVGSHCGITSAQRLSFSSCAYICMCMCV